MKASEIDISKMPEVLEQINSILRSGGIIEVKNEDYRGNVNLVVVEIIRRVKKPTR